MTAFNVYICSLVAVICVNVSCAKLSRQSCEIRDLLKCKSRLALDKVNDLKGLKSCKILSYDVYSKDIQLRKMNITHLAFMV